MEKYFSMMISQIKWLLVYTKVMQSLIISGNGKTFIIVKSTKKKKIDYLTESTQPRLERNENNKKRKIVWKEELRLTIHLSVKVLLWSSLPDIILHYPSDPKCITSTQPNKLCLVNWNEKRQVEEVVVGRWKGFVLSHDGHGTTHRPFENLFKNQPKRKICLKKKDSRTSVRLDYVE